LRVPNFVFMVRLRHHAVVECVLDVI